MSDIPVLLREDLTSDLTTLELKGDDFHHIRRVLRLKGGDPLELRDGRGLFAQAVLRDIGKHRATLDIGEAGRAQRPPLPRLHLALPLLKGRKLDWVLEKGTELGVEGFHLFVGRHCVVKRESSPARYRDIITSAFRQCKRHFLPELTDPVLFSELLTAADERGWTSIWGDENLAEEDPHRTPPADRWRIENVPESTAGRSEAGDLPFDDPAAKDEPIILAWVGPEGGFSANERDALGRSGTSIGLGPHRLRAETAALAIACRILLRDPA